MLDRISRRSLLTLAGVSGISLAGCLDSDPATETTNEGDEQVTGDNEGDSTDSDVEADDEAAGSDDQSEDDDGDEEAANDDHDQDGALPDWMVTELTDVTSDETFTVAAFDTPVLLETFAVWCPDCLEQQQESQQFHEQTDLEVESVALNVDPNEDADVVREHAEDHGFDWHFAVAPDAMTRSLVDEFGDSIAHPPASPVVLVCPDGEFRRLDDGLNTADTLESEVSAGCSS